MLVDRLRGVIDAAIEREKVVESGVADLEAPRRDIHGTDDSVARLLVVRNELIEVRVVMYPRSLWQVRPTGLYNVAVAALQARDSVAEADGGANHLLHTIFGHAQLRNVHIPGRDGRTSSRYVGRDRRHNAAAKPERLPLVDRDPIGSAFAHEVGK